MASYRILIETAAKEEGEPSTFEPTGKTIKCEPDEIEAKLDALQAETGFCHGAEAV